MATADPNAPALPGATHVLPPDLMLLAQKGRRAVESAVEALIQHLDALDGDPDLEPEIDCCGADDDIGTNNPRARALCDDGRPGDADDAEPDHEGYCEAGDDRGVPRAYRPPIRLVAAADGTRRLLNGGPL